ncbi:MAG: cell division protein FtsZ [Maricaulis sp.]|uniref:cell division protein FtsZ n=1 Tax=Maricaulis sp. TaxID=1486257 RepID=UPI001B05ACB2|nr:cell division protein FtsZ [Maricaulis sp.]MBO6730123.1 cell division protein FtsZ [Maricaulis sp.]MBO6848188.1 cell division protein FtsZ [Maricaulis sp.]MBO6877985.1 cell division protein FtsZ [Maricaulis sp.]
MTLNLSIPETTELRPRIVVFGVGGAGGNAVNNMIEASLEGVDFVVANTDAQALTRSQTDKRVQMGAAITEGLGAGARPEVGAQSAEESIDEIREHLAGAHMVFITAGMGGGTGTGAAPVVARAARDMGILTVGVVTKPFHFEGTRRMKMADSGIDQLQDHVDTLIVIPNQNLFRIATEKTTFAEAFSMADQVLHSGVRGITDLMVMPGLINLDFADVRAVMNEMGKAMMGTGEAEGEKRAVEAAQAAISNPLLDDVSMKGATGVLINITGGYDMTLYEVDEAANEIRAEVDPDANIIVGSTFDENMEGSMRVSVVATGIEAEAMAAPDPRTRTRPLERQPAVATQVASASNANDAILPWKRMNTDRPGRVMAEQRPDTPSVREEVQQEPDVQAEPMKMAAGAEELADAVAEQREIPVSDPFIAPAEQVAQAPVEAPQVVMDRERLQREAETLNARYEQRRATEAPVPSPAPETRAEEPKRGFSLFGRRRKPVESAPKTAPVAATAPSVQAPRAPSGDLFGDSLDEGDLEIPAFLRRQAN